MVFLVNQKIMGGESAKDWDLEYLLNSFFNVIVSLIDELIDIITKKLLEFVMEKIADLLSAAARLLLLEQIEYYSRLMSQMIKACMFKLPNNPNLASTLDYVDYADIDPNSEAPAKEC
jgi:NTP pyrophosphatase (non-canonical NTP hydrolase)